jgi:hypothetical protein
MVANQPGCRNRPLALYLRSANAGKAQAYYPIPEKSAKNRKTFVLEHFLSELWYLRSIPLFFAPHTLGMNYIQQERSFLRDSDMNFARRDAGYYNPDLRKPFRSMFAREQAIGRAEDCPESPAWPGQHDETRSTFPAPEGAVLHEGEGESELDWVRRRRMTIWSKPTIWSRTARTDDGCDVRSQSASPRKPSRPAIDVAVTKSEPPVWSRGTKGQDKPTVLPAPLKPHSSPSGKRA